jgi:hypothetical protein
MAAKLTARAIERVLESHDLPEVFNPPYLVSARAMFAQLAFDAIRQQRLQATWRGTTPPSDTELSPDQIGHLVRNANAFLGVFWHAQRKDEHHGRIDILPGVQADWRSGGEVTLSFNGMVTGGIKHRMASVLRPGAVTPGRLRPEEIDPAYDRAAALLPHAERILEDALGRRLPLRMESGRRGPWGYVCIRGEVDGRDVRLIMWNVNELVHRSDEDLLHRVGTIPHELSEGLRRKNRFLRTVPDIQERLDALTAGTGLPIRITIAQDTDRSAYKDARDDVWLVVDGYGPGGTARRMDMRTIASGDVEKHLPAIIEKHVKDQRRLHALYGPRPGSGRIDWRIDAVTARFGVTRRHVERCITEGSHHISDQVSIRVSGKRILGQVQLSGDVLWRGDELRAVGVIVPDSVMATIAGRRIDEVVDTPALADGGVVTSAKGNTLRNKPRLALKLRPRMIGIDELEDTCA